MTQGRLGGTKRWNTPAWWKLCAARVRQDDYRVSDRKFLAMDVIVLGLR
jgi:hypothetical protein